MKRVQAEILDSKYIKEDIAEIQIKTRAIRSIAQNFSLVFSGNFSDNLENGSESETFNKESEIAALPDSA
jgi:hypothetical protein